MAKAKLNPKGVLSAEDKRIMTRRAVREGLTLKEYMAKLKAKGQTKATYNSLKGAKFE